MHPLCFDRFVCFLATRNKSVISGCLGLLPGLLAAPAEEATPSAGGGRKRSGDNIWGEVEGTVISYIFVRYSARYTNVSVLPSHRSGNCVTQPVALRWSARGHKPSFDQRIVRKFKRYGATVPAGVHHRSSPAGEHRGPPADAPRAGCGAAPGHRWLKQMRCGRAGGTSCWSAVALDKPHRMKYCRTNGGGVRCCVVCPRWRQRVCARPGLL